LDTNRLDTSHSQRSNSGKHLDISHYEWFVSNRYVVNQDTPIIYIDHYTPLTESLSTKIVVTVSDRIVSQLTKIDINVCGMPYVHAYGIRMHTVYGIVLN